MKSNFDSEYQTFDFDATLKNPPKVLFFTAVTSITFGLSIGAISLYGVNTAKIATDRAEYFLGLIGYLLCAVIPIVLFQIYTNQHTYLTKNNREIPYDNYAGLRIQNIFKKVLAIGLLAAALSVWVFLQPIAERYA